MEQFGRLLDIMDKLRTECPWNRAQTIDTLRPMTVEEVYELSDAVLKKNEAELRKELGDVLLHIVFYSKIAQEEGRYDVADVIDGVCEKMVFRHPHVFGSMKAEDAEAVSENWEMMKTREKGGNRRVLSGVPDSMPSVLKAFAMQDKARGVGFDWKQREDVWEKVQEELEEYKAELAAAAAAESEEEKKAAMERAEAECGDFLFSIINAARLYKINPDNALERTCEKFRRRFNYLEEHTIKEGRDLHQMSLEEMDAYWDGAKKLGL